MIEKFLAIFVKIIYIGQMKHKDKIKGDYGPSRCR